MTSDFKRVLIANRGEIALRVVRACRDAALISIAVYADPDAGAPFARLADEALPLHGAAPADTYLHVAKLLAAAEQSGAEAVHPGYGFLAEDAGFAQAVIDAGLTWIGPPPRAIRALGDKVAARAIAARVGAPLVPGTPGSVADPAEAVRFAEEHGLPVAIKAAHGGGGRGLRVAREAGEVAALFEAAAREARAAFGRGECFVEAYVERGRHVEAQVLADQHGDVLVAGTRDCTLQRRYQKLVEEAPAPFLTDSQRATLERSAAAICSEAGYVGAGTVEFLLSPRGELSFLEVNTRLQVEHPVTEESADVDLVRAQLMIAAGHPLRAAIGGVQPRRHAIEFRVNAEDPAREFAPSAGQITRFRPPAGPGIRVDSGVEEGSVIGGQFDSLLAKLVVTGRDRPQAIERARRALREFEIAGVRTTLPFLRAVLAEPAFTAEGPGGLRRPHHVDRAGLPARRDGPRRRRRRARDDQGGRPLAPGRPPGPGPGPGGAPGPGPPAGTRTPAAGRAGGRRPDQRPDAGDGGADHGRRRRHRHGRPGPGRRRGDEDGEPGPRPARRPGRGPARPRGGNRRPGRPLCRVVPDPPAPGRARRRT